MKHYLLPLLILPLIANAATAEPDTARVHGLEEITVVASAQRADAAKTVYVPQQRQRLAASDGLSLLARMNIPQLNVNPLSAAVRTADGNAVTLFINFRPATPQDIAGLNPTDVKRVEYMDFPADARFLRAPHVVNFIVRDYAWGGYTKLDAKERFVVRSGLASVYSKFAARRMEYDLMLSGDYDYCGHIGSASREWYKFPSGTVTRNASGQSGRHRERSLFSGLRLSWNKSDAFSFRNLISFRRNNIPVNQTSGIVEFSKTYPLEDYLITASSLSNALAWRSELFASLPKGWTLNANVNCELIGNKTDDHYTTSLSDIVNSADEKGAFARTDLQANRALSENMSLFAAASAAWNRTDIDYAGSSNTTNKFIQTFGGLYVGASLNLKKVSGSVDAGFALESNIINDKNIADRYPFTHINLQYAPDEKNSFGLWFQYATMSPGAVMKNPNIVRQSELMYIAGNPDLLAARHITANVSYTWLPSNRVQMSAYAVLFRIMDRQIEVYTPDGPGGAMLRKYCNDGDYNHGQLGAHLTAKFFDGRLAASAAPRLLLYKVTGSNAMSHFPFMYSASVDYYLGNFFFSGYYGSPSSYVDGETSFLRKMPSEYSLSVGWAARGWNIQFTAANLFRSSWRISEDTLRTRWYDTAAVRFGADFHRRFALSVTYTFSYGRKVDNSAEITPDGDISTSILR